MLKIKLYLKAVAFLLAPAQILVALLVIALRPIVFIRLGGIIASRLGHFTLNTELAFLEVQLTRELSRQRIVCIWFLTGETSNSYLLELWKRKLLVADKVTGYFLAGVYRYLGLSLIGRSHRLVPAQHDRDIFSLMQTYKPTIQLTEHELELGNQFCEKEFGVPTNAKIVVVTIRDSAYLQSVYPNKDWSYHDYRDSTAAEYLPGLDLLANAGYYVFRMGAVVKSKLVLDGYSDKIIDYATSGRRSEFLDVYLAHRCEFCISQGTGFDGLTNMFRKPILYVNSAPIGYLYTMAPQSLAIFKEHYSLSLGRLLSVSEIFENGLAYALRSSDFKALDVLLVENSSEDIAAACSEMLKLMHNQLEYNEQELQMQEIFWSKFSNKSEANFPLHTHINMKIVSVFLNQKPYLLVDKISRE